MRVTYYKCLRFEFRTASRLQHWFVHYSNMRRMRAKLHKIEKQQKVARFARRILEGNKHALTKLSFNAWCSFWRESAYKRIMGESALSYATSLDELELKMQGMLEKDPTRSPPGPEEVYIASKIKACKAANPGVSHEDVTAKLKAEYADLTRLESAEDEYIRVKMEELRASDLEISSDALKAQARAAWNLLNHVDTPEDMYREQQREDIILNLKLEIAELEAEVERRVSEVFGGDSKEGSAPSLRGGGEAASGVGSGGSERSKADILRDLTEAAERSNADKARRREEMEAAANRRNREKRKVLAELKAQATRMRKLFAALGPGVAATPADCYAIAFPGKSYSQMIQKKPSAGAKYEAEAKLYNDANVAKAEAAGSGGDQPKSVSFLSMLKEAKDAADAKREEVLGMMGKVVPMNPKTDWHVEIENDPLAALLHFGFVDRNPPGAGPHVETARKELPSRWNSA
eukprot:g384.t1